jgi:hypothetical protein
MSRAPRLLLGFGLAATILAATASSASAQYRPRRGYYGPPPGYYPPPPPPSPRYRNGLVVGFGLGLGGISASGCDPGYCGGALSGELHIGGMVTEQLALEGEVWGNGRGIDNSDGAVTHSFWTAAAQFWVVDPLWLKAGLGISHVQTSSASLGVLTDETNLGLVLAGGAEVYRAGNFALDIQLRFGRGFYAVPVDNYALLVGFNWY